MTLTLSKAHDQAMPALARIPKSLELFGHPATQVVYTDNVHADKREFEKMYPWLLDNVVPVPEYSALELLCFPESWSVVPLTNTYHVNMRMNIIMSHHADAKPVVTAFDMKFPVDESGI